MLVDNDLAIPSSWTPDLKGDGSTRYNPIPPYDLYAGLLSGRICSPGPFMNNTIITLNYDTVLEEALGNWKIPFWYGFKPRSVEYDGSSKWARENPDGAIPLLKLHGSVNWAKPNRSGGRLNVFGSYLVIIGFSVPPTDIHFKYLLAAGLQENISLGSISCFNPCTQVEQNLFKILRPELGDGGFAKFYPNSLHRSDWGLSTVKCALQSRIL